MCEIDYELMLKFIEAFSGAFLAVFAWQGLRSWQAKLQGTDQYEVAKNLLEHYGAVVAAFEDAYLPGYTELEKAALLESDRDKNPAFRMTQALVGRSEVIFSRISELRREQVKSEFVLGVSIGSHIERLQELASKQALELVSFFEKVEGINGALKESFRTALGGKLPAPIEIPKIPSDTEAKLRTLTVAFSAELSPFKARKKGSLFSL